MSSFYTCHSLWKEFSQTIDLGVERTLPLKLYEELQGKKESSYSNGLISIVDPKRFRDLFSLWNFEPNECYPFIKSAFGVFIFFHNEQYKILNPVYNYIDILGENNEFDFVMNIMLCDNKGLESSLLSDVYFDVVDNLGPPDLDECYAFVPAIRLGGSRNKNTVQKVKLKEQLLILSYL